MKHLFFCLTLFLFVNSAEAQKITADTASADILFKHAQTLKNQRRYDSALLLYREAVPLYKQHKPPEKYYNCRVGEISCLESLSKLDSALHFGKQYLREAEKELPKLSEAKAGLLNSLGVICYKQAQYQTALEYWQESLNIKREIFGEKHTYVANAYNSIAAVHYSQTQYQKALEYWHKSLSIFSELYGEKHTTVADSYNNIAIVYKRQSQYKKALEFYQKALSTFLEVYGEKHTSVAGIYNNIANVYKEQLKYKEALEFYQKALNIKTELFGKRHTRVAQTYTNIAVVYKRRAQYEKALEFYRKALSIFSEILGEKHTSVALIYDNLALLYLDLEQYDSAVYFHHQAVKAISLGFDSDDIAENPNPEQALEKNELMKFLRRKAEALVILNKEKEALKSYTAASGCAEKAMSEAVREKDKLRVASGAYSTYTQGALLHFLQKKKIQKIPDEGEK